MSARLPRSPLQRQTILNRSMIPNAGGGRSSIVAPEPRPLAPLPLSSGGATGGAAARFATLVVAASNTSAAGKAAADYVCTGTADDVTIQQALTDLNNAGVVPHQSGDILCLEGDYDITAPLVPATDTWLHGVGNVHGTRFHGSDAHATIDNQDAGGLTVTDIEFIDGLGAINFDVVSSSCTIERNVFNSCKQAILGAAPGSGADSSVVYYLRLIHNRFDGCGDGSHPIVDLNRRVFHLLMSGNDFDNTTGGAVNFDATITPATDVSDTLAITGNLFDGDVKLTSAQFVSFTGNTSEFFDLYMTSVDHLALAGNVFANYNEATCTDVAKAGNVGTGF